MDLPASVTFDPRADGWRLEQDEDVFESVQAFLDRELIIELWGTTTLRAPDGTITSSSFQQNVWIELGSKTWRAKRWASRTSIFDLETAIEFKLAGTLPAVSQRRVSH